MGFILNGDFWRVSIVRQNDKRLIDRTGSSRLATTDPSRREICLSNVLSGDMLSRVLIHEIGHATLVSYGLLDELHAMVYPDMWVQAEEWVCNLIADYGAEMQGIAYSILGNGKPFVPKRGIA